MAIADWPARRIARMWVVGLALEAALIAGSKALERANEPPWAREMRLRSDSLERGLVPPPPPITAAQESTLRAFVRDSLGITWETHGRVTTLHLPPAVERDARRAARAIQGALVAVAIVVLLIFGPIPLTLVSVTIVWVARRRPWRRARVDGGTA